VLVLFFAADVCLVGFHDLAFAAERAARLRRVGDGRRWVAVLGKALDRRDLAG
jgi:hypothetical protein